MNANPEALIKLLVQGEDPLTHAAALLYRALDHPDGVPYHRSVAQCHSAGIDSIVLFDGGPEVGMVRFYLSHAGISQLHRLYGSDGNFTVGVHNHRYQIAKIALDHPFTNVRTSVADDEEDPMVDYPYLEEYRFTSGLTGEMGVEWVDTRRMRPLQPDLILPGEVAIMQPEDLHTIVTPRTKDTAWMVIEGPAVPDIEPLIYSPRIDFQPSAEGLYEGVDREYVRSAIRYVLGRMV